MKTIFTILLSFLFLTSRAQRSYEPIKIIGLYTASIVLNGIGDGLNDDGNKDWGHLCNAGSIGLLLASPFVIHYDKKKWYCYLISYTSLRIAFFDYSYNKTRGLDWNYHGTSNWWDKSIGQLPPFHRGIALIFGISIPINELK